jgi:hypothetical protein
MAKEVPPSGPLLFSIAPPQAVTPFSTSNFPDPESGIASLSACLVLKWPGNLVKLLWRNPHPLIGYSDRQFAPIM